MRVSCKKLKEYIEDERESSREYARLGFKRQAADEARHARFFKKKAKALKCCGGR